MNPKRHSEAKEQIAAAKVMPGNADLEQPSDPEETPYAADAAKPVKGSAGIPGVLPGTTFGRGGKGS